MFNNREEYILRSRIGRLKLDIDPMGWKDTETEIGRSEKTFGIFIAESNNLKFTGKAKEFLELNWQIDGVKAKVELIKRMKHPQTDEWFIPKGFPGFLDYKTWKIEDRKFSIDFIEGGLREVLTSQIREKFELDRTQSILGDPITPLVTDELSIKGREIYLLSKLSTTDNFTVHSGVWRPTSYEYRDSYTTFPINVDANSDPLNIQSAYHTPGIDQRWEVPSLMNMFFSTSEMDRGKVVLKGNVAFKLENTTAINARNLSFQVVLDRYDADLVRIDRIPISGDPINPEAFEGQYFSYPINFTFDDENEIKTGESLTLGIYNDGEYSSNVTSEGYSILSFSEVNIALSWAEYSFFERTNAPFLTAYEVGQRLTEIYTGKRKFISDLLSSGGWKDLGFSCGGWIRNLQKKVEVKDAQGIVIRTDLKPWPLTISFDDFYKSIHAPFPVGYGIVTKGAKQFIALESIRYFFQPYVTIKLGEVSKLKRSAADEFMFSSITTGYTKGGNYEKPLGLDEYNIQATRTTPIVEGDNKYEALGTSRTDSYAVEQARRMQYFLFPDEDTPFDKDNFLIDAKFITRSNVKNYYEVRLWQDDFEQSPTGVYSPETAFNLRLSPVNNLHRHSQWFKSALYKYPNDYLRFASSEGNSELETKLPGKPARKENGNTLISELANPIFEPEWVEFETPFEQEILEQLQGTTIINDKEINNYYGLVEYTTEGKKERGYLFSAKIKNNITFKILKSYGF